MPILDSTRRVLVFILQVLENLSLERVNALISSLKSQFSTTPLILIVWLKRLKIQRLNVLRLLGLVW
jgi:hypothetical protein